MGFDYGHKRIGVAIGQGITNTATPVAIVNAKNGEPCWQEIQKLIAQPGFSQLPHLSTGAFNSFSREIFTTALETLATVGPYELSYRMALGGSYTKQIPIVLKNCYQNFNYNYLQSFWPLHTNQGGSVSSPLGST